MSVLKAENIGKSFRVGFSKTKKVLENIHFTAQKGEFICIIGKSGEGKTTFLKILAGIIKPTSGSISFNQHKLGFFRGFYRKKISFIFQDYKLIPHLNVFENVSLPLRIRDIPSWKENTLKWMNYVGIAKLKQQYPYQISGGESQRASIARALNIEPEIIFADEPTGNLDIETGREVITLFKEIHTKLNKTFIIVTHDHTILEEADRIYRITGGKILEVDKKTLNSNS